MACSAAVQCIPERYRGVGLSSESKEGEDPGSWELGLKSVKRLRMLPGQAKEELPSLSSPAQEQGDTDGTSKMEIQNIRNDILT